MGLLAVNGKRKLACSLVEGRWPTQAADAKTGRDLKLGRGRLFPSDGG